MLIGSFLNVVIYRLPREQSVVKPRSSCPKCGHMITWYENIPVVSYLFLKGKCSQCSAKISIKYPLVEMLLGLIALGISPDVLTPMNLATFVIYFSIAACFIAHFIIDLEFQILPDKINLYLLAIILPFSILTKQPAYWLVGGAIGFGGPFLITYLFYKLRGQIGLGGGDIKLYGIIGVLLGPLGVLKTIFMSCALGSIVGLALILSKKMSKETPLAFGPYIIIIAALQIFFPEIVEYFDFFKF